MIFHLILTSLHFWPRGVDGIRQNPLLYGVSPTTQMLFSLKAQGCSAESQHPWINWLIGHYCHVLSWNIIVIISDFITASSHRAFSSFTWSRFVFVLTNTRKIYTNALYKAIFSHSIARYPTSASLIVRMRNQPSKILSPPHGYE